ncbi:hypothetical protein [Methyloligella solikamskensis]|uniref:Uncharacterized protein n=1 Tax=Methyloligella solikamskensis TaxID=1177756 RepID=A0ABW3J913_9HYPH
MEGVSKYPGVGRFHLRGFEYDDSNVYAAIRYQVGNYIPDRNYALRDHSHLSLKCDVDHLGAMIQMLPEGEERDYIEAVFEVVEAMNSYNFDLREVLDFAHMPSATQSFNEIMRDGFVRKKEELDSAMKRLLSFDPDTAKGAKKEFPLH